MSDGSLSTVLSLMSTYGISWLLPGNPWSLTSKSRATKTRSTSLFSGIFGCKKIPVLGEVTTSFLAICNESIIHRSASLLPKVYGQRFSFYKYAPVPNIWTAVLIHVLTRLGALLLAFPLLRWGLWKVILTPGSGPDLTTANIEKQTFRVVGNSAAADGRKVEASFVYEGSLYGCSAYMGVEAALVILGGEETPIHRIGGGIMTPALLGVTFVEKLRKAGAKLTTETLL